jgi:hypothetical protein
MSKINISFDLNTDELNCVVCFSSLNSNIYTCVKGPHYCCEKCNEKIKECPCCRNKDKFVRNISLEQNLKKYLIPCQNKCGTNIFQWDKDHKNECVNSPTCCHFCNREVKSKVSELISHYRDYCDNKFNITNIDLKKNKFKYIIEKTRNIIIINNKYAIITFYKNGNYIIEALSDNEEFINKKVKISTTNGTSNYNIEIKIKSGKNLKYETIIPSILGNNYIFEGPLVNKNDDDFITTFLNILENGARNSTFDPNMERVGSWSRYN